METVDRMAWREEPNENNSEVVRMRARSSAMSLLSIVDSSWGDCASLQSDDGLYLEDEEMFDWDISDVLNQETNVEMPEVSEESLSGEEMMIPEEVELTTQQQQQQSTPGPPEVSEESLSGKEMMIPKEAELTTTPGPPEVSDESLSGEETMIPKGAKPIKQQQSKQGPPASDPMIPREIQAIGMAGLPMFTPEDMTVELASLTNPEIQGIISDLHGIPHVVASLSMDSSTSRLPRLTLLSLLDDAVYKLPVEQKVAYCEAVLKCPGLVSDKRKMAFLEREGGNPVLAAVRLARYWELRLEIFGPEKCFLPMTLRGAMRDEVENMVKWPVHQLLPTKDTAGRAIWYLNVSRRDLDNYSVELELMAVWYVFEVAMEDPEVLKQGIVLVSNFKDSGMKQYQSKEKPVEIPAKRLAIIDDVMPIRLRALHFCQPSLGASYFLPLIMQGIGRNYRQRVRLHCGSKEGVLQGLKSLCLPRDRLPTELGGQVVLNWAKYLSERMVVEGFRPDPRLVSDQTPISIPTCTDPATNLPKNDENATVATVKPASSFLNSRATTGKTDPRMALAVKNRLADPDKPLLDALVEAGFNFNFTNEKGQTVDADNITLRQRKNNLCRRVRQEKSRRAVQDASPTSKPSAVVVKS